MNKVHTAFWNWADKYYGSDIDKIDVEALYDRTLTVEENITLFKENIPYEQAPTKKPSEQETPTSTPLSAYNSTKKVLDLMSKPCIIGVVADVNQGKSMLLYQLIEEAKKEHKFNLYYYGLRKDLSLGTRIYSVEELENIRNSVVIIDELSSLFNLDDRKVKSSTENTLRLINHNNNIVILCGVPENFKKFISAKVDYYLFKKCTIADFINGSRVKNVVNSYRGEEKGSAVLNISIGEALLYDGKHYSRIITKYNPSYDTKKENSSVLQKVPKKVE